MSQVHPVMFRVPPRLALVISQVHAVVSQSIPGFVPGPSLPVYPRLRPSCTLLCPTLSPVLSQVHMVVPQVSLCLSPLVSQPIPGYVLGIPGCVPASPWFCPRYTRLCPRSFPACLSPVVFQPVPGFVPSTPGYVPGLFQPIPTCVPVYPCFFPGYTRLYCSLSVRGFVLSTPGCVPGPSLPVYPHLCPSLPVPSTPGYVPGLSQSIPGFVPSTPGLSQVPPCLSNPGCVPACPGYTWLCSIRKFLPSSSPGMRLLNQVFEVFLRMCGSWSEMRVWRLPCGSWMSRSGAVRTLWGYTGPGVVVCLCREKPNQGWGTDGKGLGGLVVRAGHASVMWGKKPQVLD